MPARKPLLRLYLIMAKITGPTERDKNSPKPKPAISEVIINKQLLCFRIGKLSYLKITLKCTRKLAQFYEVALTNDRRSLACKKFSQSACISFFITRGNLFIAPA